MLLQFSVRQNLSPPSANLLIRSCSLQFPTKPSTEDPVPMENPKRYLHLLKGPLEVIPACGMDGTEVSSDIEVITSVTPVRNASSVLTL